MKVITMRSIITLLISGIIIFTGCKKDDPYLQEELEETASYQLTFNATWSKNTHPTDFPANPHFSGLIGMTHNMQTSLFKIGSLASQGIKEMAEKGNKSPLSQEIETKINAGTAGQLISGAGISESPSSVNLNFNINRSHSFVSIVSMIAPSPDWFIAIENINLLLPNGQWTDSKAIDVIAYDAGTDKGLEYTSADSANNPPELISVISAAPFISNASVQPLGTIIVNKINQ